MNLHFGAGKKAISTVLSIQMSELRGQQQNRGSAPLSGIVDPTGVEASGRGFLGPETNDRAGQDRRYLHGSSDCLPDLDGRIARAANTVAAIIPMYNGARFIETAINSILAQTRMPDEVIVVDDGSTDKGPDLVEKLSEKAPIRLLRKSNGGQSSARNFGVSQSSSTLIALLDQDDIWYPKHLSVLIEPFDETGNRDLGWSYSNLDKGDESGSLLTPSFLHTRSARHPKTSLRDCVADDMFVLPSASLISRAAFEAVGGFDEALSGYEDDDLFLRIFMAGYPHIFIDTPLSMWRIYGSSTTSTPLMTRSRDRKSVV